MAGNKIINVEKIIFMLKSLRNSLHTFHLCLPFPAIKHCGISRKDLANADPFPLVFKRMMKWVTNRTLAASRKSRKKGKQQKMFYPGKFEAFSPCKGLFALQFFLRKCASLGFK